MAQSARAEEHPADAEQARRQAPAENAPADRAAYGTTEAGMDTLSRSAQSSSETDLRQQGDVEGAQQIDDFVAKFPVAVMLGLAYRLRHREILTPCLSAAIRTIISRSFPAASRGVRRSVIDGGA